MKQQATEVKCQLISSLSVSPCLGAFAAEQNSGHFPGPRSQHSLSCHRQPQTPQNKKDETSKRQKGSAGPALCRPLRRPLPGAGKNKEHSAACMCTIVGPAVWRGCGDRLVVQLLGRRQWGRGCWDRKVRLVLGTTVLGTHAQLQQSGSLRGLRPAPKLMKGCWPRLTAAHSRAPTRHRAKTTALRLWTGQGPTRRAGLQTGPPPDASLQRRAPRPPRRRRPTVPHTCTTVALAKPRPLDDAGATKINSAT